MSSSWNVEVGVKVDASGVQQQLSNLGLKPIEVDAKLSEASVRNIKSSLSNALNGSKVDSRAASNMFVGVEKAAAKSGTSVAKSFAGAFGKVDFKDINQQLDAIEKRKVSLANLSPGMSTTYNTYKQLKSELDQISKLTKDVSRLDFGKNSEEIARVTSRIEELRSAYKNTLGAIGSNLKPGEINTLNKILENTGFELDRIKAKSVDAFNFDKAKAEAKATADTTKTSITQIKDAVNQLGQQKIKLLGLDEMSKDADEVRAKIAALETQIKEMMLGLGNTTSTQDASILRSIDKMEQRVANKRNEMLRGISDDVLSRKYGTLADDYARKVNSSDSASYMAKNQAKYLQTLAADLSNAHSEMQKYAKGTQEYIAAQDRMISSAKEFSRVESSLKNSIKDFSGLDKQAKAAEKTAVAYENLELKKTNFADSIDLWRKNHSSVIGTDFDTQLKNIQGRISDINSPGALNNLKAEFSQVTTQAQLADKASLNLGDRIKNQIKQYATYFGVAGAMMIGTQGIRSMYNNTLQVDTEMTELRRVTDLSESQYSQLFTEMTASAKEYGVALSDVISATADWSRAGFDANTSKELAEITTMYQHVSDLDYDEAAQNLLTSYKGFEKQLTERYAGDTAEAVGHIGDILNELDNNYAVTAAGVGEGLKRSASALDVANNTLEESAA